MVNYLEESKADAVLDSFMRDFWSTLSNSGDISGVLDRYEKQTIGGIIVGTPRFASNDLTNRAA